MTSWKQNGTSLLVDPLRQDTCVPYNPLRSLQEVFKTGSTTLGQMLAFPNTATPEIHMVRVTLPRGHETGWHLHPVPSFVYVLNGLLTIVTENLMLHFSKGQGFAESINVMHNGQNLGIVDVELLIVLLGVRGEATTIASAHPAHRMCCSDNFNIESLGSRL